MAPFYVESAMKRRRRRSRGQKSYAGREVTVIMQSIAYFPQQWYPLDRALHVVDLI